MTGLDDLDDRYRVILCDIWGCIHDGVALYPGVRERLCRWKGEGRKVILITNAPRTAQAVAGQLGRLGLDPALERRGPNHHPYHQCSEDCGGGCGAAAPARA